MNFNRLRIAAAAALAVMALLGPWPSAAQAPGWTQVGAVDVVLGLSSLKLRPATWR
jgi:hypothetical protein